MFREKTQAQGGKTENVNVRTVEAIRQSGITCVKQMTGKKSDVAAIRSQNMRCRCDEKSYLSKQNLNEGPPFRNTQFFKPKLHPPQMPKKLSLFHKSRKHDKGCGNKSVFSFQ